MLIVIVVRKVPKIIKKFSIIVDKNSLITGLALKSNIVGEFYIADRGFIG